MHKLPRRDGVTVEVPKVSECTLCLFSIPCDFILEFLDRVNRIDDRRWGGVVVEGGLYECKRFLVVRQSIMGAASLVKHCPMNSPVVWSTAVSCCSAMTQLGLQVSSSAAANPERNALFAHSLYRVIHWVSQHSTESCLHTCGFLNSLVELASQISDRPLLSPVSNDGLVYSGHGARCNLQDETHSA